MATKTSQTDEAEQAATGNYCVESYRKLGEAVGAFFRQPPVYKPSRRYDALAMFSAWNDVVSGAFAHPDKVLRAQADAWSEWGRFWTNIWDTSGEVEPVAAPERGDRRFKGEEWDKNPFYRSVKESHLLIARQMRELIEASTEADPSKRALASLLLEQYLNAVAPTNFVVTNPDVLRRTVDTGGANLVAGFANLLSDITEGRGIIRRRTDDKAFELGKNLAATPGEVIYQNDLMQLIQYAPATKTVRARPLLYVPPLVNKYYMIDLQPRSSLVKWLVDQGQTVFLISWVDPNESHRHCEVDDYVGRGVLEALDKVIECTGESSVDLFGFCMGGTLIAMADAVLAARGEIDKVGTSTLIGALVDFEDMKEWSAFVNEAHVDALEGHIETKGYIDKDELHQLFAMMRANDLIWSSWVSHYLLDKDSPPSDLLFWFEDGSHIPQAFLRSYNRKLLLEDHLRVPGAVELLGEKLDLTKVSAPLMIIGLKDDHVSAWPSVYRGHQYFGGPVEFVLGGSGHNAGVINPPAANKHGYWTNPGLASDAGAWLQNAGKHEGSWWPHWVQWLEKNDKGGQVPARKPGCSKLKPIEPAPGSFVLKPERLQDA